MKKQLHVPTQMIFMVMITSFFLLHLTGKGQSVSSFKDKRDGQTYQTIQIGAKTWMAENLKFLHPTGCWAYNDSTPNVTTYGYLYNWDAAQVVCPKGWHLPTVDEFEGLIRFYGGDDKAGERLKEQDTIFWNQSGSISGDSGHHFTLLGGTRHSDQTYTGMMIWGGLWSSSLNQEQDPVNYLFARGSQGISQSSNNRSSGFSVRCVRKK